MNRPLPFQGPEILESYATPATLTKKEKHQSKKETFLQRMDARSIALLSLCSLCLGLESPLPYSRSHGRRLRRKAKEQIIGGDLKDLQTAIAALDHGDEPPDSHASVDGSTPSTPKHRLKPGQIGEGKKNPLSKSQRKHALYVVSLGFSLTA
jgi:hypothetical protein